MNDNEIRAVSEGYGEMVRGELHLYHCPVCREDNCAEAVSCGFCCWCGWNYKGLEEA